MARAAAVAGLTYPRLIGKIADVAYARYDIG
jgi:hypothetical protein